MVYGYKIVNGLIQPLGSSDELDRLEKALDMAGIDHADMLTQETPLVMADGKYYLSETDPAYLVAKAAQEQEQEISEVDAQYREDKEQLLEYYTEALMLEDTALQADIKAELTALNEQYDADITALTEV